jgi:hypothetical protein
VRVEKGKEKNPTKNMTKEILCDFAVIRIYSGSHYQTYDDIKMKAVFFMKKRNVNLKEKKIEIYGAHFNCSK